MVSVDMDYATPYFYRDREHDYAMSVICLPQFTVPWCHDGRPYIKGAGKVKSLVKKPAPSPA